MRIEIFDRMEECTEAEVQRLLPLVSAQRREQALRYKHALGRFCCLKSWLMLNDLLDENEKGLMEEWTYNEQGKPSFHHTPYTVHPHFSISHCKEAIAVVVDNQPVGVDIEAIRHADKDLIERTMNEAEQAEIFGAKEPDRVFTRLWTQKEAIVKCQGVGIQSFEQLQKTLENGDWTLETIEKEKYIYSIAYGKLHCIGAQIPPSDL